MTGFKDGTLAITYKRSMIRQIPNVFTLLNLFFGCLAIIATVQTGLTIGVDSNGQQIVEIPERIYLASIFIGIAAVIDFLDGFVARLLKVPSEIGKQLDSLADVVSFGVAPGMIVYQFLRLSFAQQENGLDIAMFWLLPAFIVPCAGAYRLARFNIDMEQSYGFKGVPIPAAGLFIASFPLIYWFSFEKSLWILPVLTSKWFWYGLVIFISYLMVSKLPMMALKFKKKEIDEINILKIKDDFSGKKITLKTTNLTGNFKLLMPFIIIAIVSLISAIFLGWLAVPIGFIAYVILSLVFKQHTSKQQ